jgi:hypothetical protein
VKSTVQFTENAVLDKSAIESKFLQDLFGQLARSNWLASDHLLLDKLEHFALHLVRPLGAPLPGYQPGDPRFFEAGFGLIVRRPGYAVFLRCACHTCVFDRYASQHLVFDLHDVVRVEELDVEEFRIRDLLRRWIQRPLFEQGLDPGILALSFYGHRALSDSAFQM